MLFKTIKKKVLVRLSLSILYNPIFVTLTQGTILWLQGAWRMPNSVPDCCSAQGSGMRYTEMVAWRRRVNLEVAYPIELHAHVQWSGKDGCRKWGIRKWRDSEKEVFGKGGVWERRESGNEGFWKGKGGLGNGGMQERRNSGEEGCRKEGILNRRDSGKEEFGKEGIRERGKLLPDSLFSL